MKCVVTSIEGEYYTFANTTMFLWMRCLLQAFGIGYSTTTLIYYDDQIAIQITHS